MDAASDSDPQLNRRRRTSETRKSLTSQTSTQTLFGQSGGHGNGRRDIGKWRLANEMQVTGFRISITEKVLKAQLVLSCIRGSLM